MLITNWKPGAVTLAIVGLIWGYAAFGQPPAPPPGLAVRPGPPAAADNPADPSGEGAWFPKKPGDALATAFPDTAKLDRRLPPGEHGKELAKLCPRLFGKNPLSIEPADDTYRRLLKARLYQALQEVEDFHRRLAMFAAAEFAEYARCQEDIRGVVVELWGNDPKTLTPWLEELVVLAKEWERSINLRITAGADPPHHLNGVRRHRLAAETALWKAKNGKLEGR